MNQGQLEVVKQEMARLNINILGIRLLCPWDFPDKNTGVDSHSPLQKIFLTQGLNPELQADSLPSEPPGKQGDDIIYHPRQDTFFQEKS